MDERTIAEMEDAEFAAEEAAIEAMLAPEPTYIIRTSAR